MSNQGLRIDTENDSMDDLYKYVHIGERRNRSNTAGTYGLYGEGHDLANQNHPQEAQTPIPPNLYPQTPITQAFYPPAPIPQPPVSNEPISGGSSISNEPPRTISTDPISNEMMDPNDPHNPNSPEFKNFRFWSRIFFITSAVSALLILVLEIYVYAVINVHKSDIGSDAKYQEVSIFLALFIFAAVFQVIITWIGLKTKNILLLLTLCGFYACMLIYTGIQYNEVRALVGDILEGNWKRATRATNITTICVIAATLVIQLYIIMAHLSRHIKWFRFKTIGADIYLKRMYQILQVHRSLLMFAFFFFLGFTIQFIIIMVDDKSSKEFILTVCVLPLTIILLILSDLAVSNEYYWLALPCVGAYLGGMAYVLFKMIRLYTKYTSAYHLTVNPGDYFPGRSSLITFGVITLVLLVTIIVLEVILMINFNGGLKPIVKNPHYFIFRKRRVLVEEPKDQFSID